jgi:hypothetical protein
VGKTLAALYRMLRDDFEQRRPANCSCRMPMILEAERLSADKPNWRVEPLWCGSIECQCALRGCISRHARIYDLVRSDTDGSGTGEMVRF